MIRVVYRTAPAVAPALLETWISSPHTVGEVVIVEVDELNLSSYSPSTQEALRVANTDRWEVVSCERQLPGVGHASPTSAADEKQEVILRPKFPEGTASGAKPKGDHS